jgi:hypothetical protein
MTDIIVTEGELRQGESITLTIDFSGNYISSFYTNKRFIAFAERNVKWDTFTEEYYFEADEGIFFEALNSNDLRVTELVAGRLFTKVTYTDLQGNDVEIKKVFQVLPSRTITIPSETVAGQTATFKNENSYDSVVTTYQFSHDSSTVTVSGGNADKVVANSGYYVVNIGIDWTNSEYSNGDPIVWDSNPVDLLTIPSGYFGGGSIDNQTVTEAVSGRYLIKEDLSQKFSFDMKFTKSFDNEITAPLKGYLIDNNTYDYSFEGDDRIEYVEIDFGDGEKVRSYQIGDDLIHTFKRSGQYVIKFIINTVHELPEITYRQSITHRTTVDIEPFFFKMFASLFESSIYNSDGFRDLCFAWGSQMDRLYNETQTFMDSIDSNNIDNKFLPSLAATFGDFPEIYEKIGFREFSTELEDDKRFDLFSSYNFFDRIKTGDLTSEEKQQFVRYIQETKDRLAGKGTPASLEQIVSFFALEATVKELWTRFENQEVKAGIYLDEVFDGGKTENDTKLTFRRVSMPQTDNEDNFISDRTDTSYIEINTFDNVYNTYYTPDSNMVNKEGKQFLWMDFDYNLDVSFLNSDSITQITEGPELIEDGSFTYGISGWIPDNMLSRLDASGDAILTWENNNSLKIQNVDSYVGKGMARYKTIDIVPGIYVARCNTINQNIYDVGGAVLIIAREGELVGDIIGITPIAEGNQAQTNPQTIVFEIPEGVNRIDLGIYINDTNYDARSPANAYVFVDNVSLKRIYITSYCE